MADLTFNKLYLYDHVRQLLIADGNSCFLKDNAPMHKQPIKAHKGIDNKIIFRALSPDRTPVGIPCTQQVYARIIDPMNNTVVLEKLCICGPAKGIISLLLDSGDIAGIASGTYSMVIIRTEEFVTNIPGYYVEKAMYSDMNDNISMEIVITEQALKTPTPSVVITPKDWTADWSSTAQTYGRPCFYSSRIPGGRVMNHKESVQSFSTYTENFTGILELWGTLEETPDAYLSESRWFKIYPSTMSHDIEYAGYTGTQAWTFTQGALWYKFRLIPSTAVFEHGKMSKIIMRN